MWKKKLWKKSDFFYEEYFPLKITIGICLSPMHMHRHIYRHMHMHMQYAGILNFVKNIHPWKNPKKILICTWKLSGTYLINYLVGHRNSVLLFKNTYFNHHEYIYTVLKKSLTTNFLLLDTSGEFSIYLSPSDYVCRYKFSRGLYIYIYCFGAKLLYKRLCLSFCLPPSIFNA